MRVPLCYSAADDAERAGKAAMRRAAPWGERALPGYVGGRLLREGTVGAQWLEHWLAERAAPPMSPAGRP